MRQKLFKWLVPLFTVVVTLALLDLGVSVIYPVPYSAEHNFYFEPDPHTGYLIRPNSTGVFYNGVEANANSNGHNDDEATVSKPEGVFRVLVLGDSFTMGASVSREDGYPRQLEQLLNESSSTQIEVINTGVGGWAPFQYAQYLEYYGLAFEPDLVLIGFFTGNDTYAPIESVEDISTAIMGRRVSRESAASPYIKLKVLLYEHSQLFRLIINSNRGESADYAREHCEDFNNWFLTYQKRRMANHIKRSPEQEKLVRRTVNQVQRIKDLAEPRGIPVIAVLIPDENQINEGLQRTILEPEEFSNYDFDMPQAMLTDYFVQMGVPVIDLLDAFREDERCLYANDNHWISEGHALGAEVIATAIGPVVASMTQE